MLSQTEFLERNVVEISDLFNLFKSLPWILSTQKIKFKQFALAIAKLVLGNEPEKIDVDWLDLEAQRHIQDNDDVDDHDPGI